MERPKHFYLMVALIGITASTACEPSTAPVSREQPAVRSNFINGPGALPQILRFEGRTISGWVDEARNTAIIIGAPLNPAQSRICGGTVRNQFMPIQLVGDVDALKQLLQEHDANVFVYDEVAPTLEDALCGSDPAAWGVGFYLRSDNDLLGTGGNRTNAFSEHVHARVELATGGFGTVNAALGGVGRDGALVFVRTSVILNTGGD